MDDPQAMDESKAFRGINFADLLTAYREFCKNEQVPTPAVNLAEVIDFYNKALTDLPDHSKLKGLKLPGASVVLDRKGERFAEVFEENQRRVWVLLTDIPAQVQKAFLAAEDKRFYEHKGIDERGIIRAFIGNLALSARPQGRPTLTPQIVTTTASFAPSSAILPIPAGRKAARPSPSRLSRTCWWARTSPTTARSAR